MKRFPDKAAELAPGTDFCRGLFLCFRCGMDQVLKTQETAGDNDHANHDPDNNQTGISPGFFCMIGIWEITGHFFFHIAIRARRSGFALFFLKLELKLPLWL